MAIRRMHIGGCMGTYDCGKPLDGQSQAAQLASLETRVARLLDAIERWHGSMQVDSEEFAAVEDILVYAAGLGLMSRPATLFVSKKLQDQFLDDARQERRGTAGTQPGKMEDDDGNEG